jgi:anti-sigma factor RsiW
LDDYLDRQLTPEERRLVEAHLATCTECAAKFRFETSFVTQVRDRLRRIDLPPQLTQRLHARLMAIGETPGELPG